MANIALTNRCNLRCPYCFAHEFVADDKNDITPERFDAALAFITKTGPHPVGFIGGEPTLHPRFGEYLTKALENPLVTQVTVYTNGILLGQYAELLANSKCHVLVNWNAESIIGTEAFARTRENVDKLLATDPSMVNRMNLGLNLYDDTMDYSYMIELLHRYGLKNLRISLTVPDFSRTSCATAGASLAYFRERKAFVWQLLHDFDDAGILPYFDCNRPPKCIWTAEEWAWLTDYVARYPGQNNSVASPLSACRPVIDIMPDLTAIRCFALSEFEPVNIADFDNLEELNNRFMRRVDRPAFRIFAEPECENCSLRRTWQCCQGCMGFKLPEIPEHRIAADLA